MVVFIIMFFSTHKIFGVAVVFGCIPFFMNRQYMLSGHFNVLFCLLCFLFIVDGLHCY